MSFTDQLNAGIRFLQMQSHINTFRNLDLCHTSCFLEDDVYVSTYLSTIKLGLDSNPNEVVTLLLIDGDISLFDVAFVSSGLKRYVYVPSTSPLTLNEWPTLRDFIDVGARLIAALDYGAKSTSISYICSTNLSTSLRRHCRCMTIGGANKRGSG